MGHTFSRIQFHVIFSTKARRNSLYRAMREDLTAYLSGICRTDGVQTIAANAVEDHVHILLRTRPVHAPADVVKKLKANSSRWIHDSYPELRDFAWQSGYGVFSVSESAVPEVVDYIEKQEEHHRRVPFAEEFARFLARHGIEYDRERYLD